MRTSIWVAALALGLCLASSASASDIAAFGGVSSPSQATNTSSPGIGLTQYLLNTFSLTNLFSSFSMTAKTQIGTSQGTIPDPSTPAYLAAFGYQRLGH